MQSILDLSQRQDVMAITGGDDPAVLEELWERRPAQSCGFRLSPFITLFLCDEPFGRFENYLVTAPPFIL
jgi:hypothetical protein